MLDQTQVHGVAGPSFKIVVNCVVHLTLFQLFENFFFCNVRNEMFKVSPVNRDRNFLSCCVGGITQDARHSFRNVTLWNVSFLLCGLVNAARSSCCIVDDCLGAKLLVRAVSKWINSALLFWCAKVVCLSWCIGSITQHANCIFSGVAMWNRSFLVQLLDVACAYCYIGRVSPDSPGVGAFCLAAGRGLVSYSLIALSV